MAQKDKKSQGHASSPATTSAAPSPLEHTRDGNNAYAYDVEKRGLELEKLRFEATTSKKLEIFKGIGVFVTTLGILGTLWLGISQLRETQASHDDERFERAVARLASSQATERLTGLAAVQQFLRSPDSSRQESTLRYLVNAVVIEHDPTVRSAILDVLNSLSDLHLNRHALSEGLATARDRNRAILRRLMDEFTNAQTVAKKRLVGSSYSEVPIGNPPLDERAPLDSSAAAIAALVRAGGRVDDLSLTYCVECKFSTLASPSHLANVSFENAFLRRADFSGADLHSSSFHNADLILTNFTSANLESADFSEDAPLESWTEAAAVYSGNLASSWGATFACSDLSKTNFGGRTIVTLIYEDPVYGGASHDEFYKANLDGAKLGKVSALIAIPAQMMSSVGTPGSILPKEFSPIDGVASPTGNQVDYFDKGKYALWQSDLNSGIKQLPNPYRRDLVVAMSSLAAASHVESAELPDGLRSFIAENAGIISKPFVSFDCKGGKSVDVSDVLSPSDKGPKATRF